MRSRKPNKRNGGDRSKIRQPRPSPCLPPPTPSTSTFTRHPRPTSRLGGPSSPQTSAGKMQITKTVRRSFRSSLSVHAPGQNTPSSASLFRKASAMQVSKYQPQIQTAVFMSGGTFLSSLPSGKRQPPASSVRSSAISASGLYLKENGTIRPRTSLSLSQAHPCQATEVEGTFRINGSNKRMRELQAAFETPPRVRFPLFYLQKTTHDMNVVWQRLGLETRDLHYTRCGKCVPQIPHPDACQYLFGPTMDLLTVA